jgi:hypothetical protein
MRNALKTAAIRSNPPARRDTMIAAVRSSGDVFRCRVDRVAVKATAVIPKEAPRDPAGC